MKIGIGNDHAAVEMKNEVVEYLKEKGCEVVNYGTDTHEIRQTAVTIRSMVKKSDVQLWQEKLTWEY